MGVRWYPTTSQGLQLKWSDGWIELFPEGEFRNECLDKSRKIQMYHKRRDKSYEPCDQQYSLTVEGKIAVLNYGGRFEKANSAPERNLYIGETKIVFWDNTRSFVRRVLWRDKGKKKFEDYETDFSWQRETVPAILDPFKLPPNQNKIRRNALTVLRPGQISFRKKMLPVYNERCCITGFDIKEALEAAHIVPFQGELSDHIQNGLLLRADLHRLFDALLISINPTTLKVEVNSSIRTKKNSLYSGLNNLKLRLPKKKGHQPAKVALEYHWNQFKMSFGKLN
jgi:hypothetical protein